MVFYAYKHITRIAMTKPIPLTQYFLYEVISSSFFQVSVFIIISSKLKSTIHMELMMGMMKNMKYIFSFYFFLPWYFYFCSFLLSFFLSRAYIYVWDRTSEFLPFSIFLAHRCNQIWRKYDEYSSLSLYKNENVYIKDTTWMCGKFFSWVDVDL